MNRLYTFISLCIALVVSGTGLSQTVFSYTGSTASYTVPAGVTMISIQAKGAKGMNGSSGGIGGAGATMYGEFAVSPGDMLTVYAGGNPAGTQTGGDGSYVVNTTTATLLIVAGGGGGSAYIHDAPGAPVTGDGTDVYPSSAYGDGTPGTGGNGGTAGAGAWGTGGGGGYLTAGTSGSTAGGAAPCRASTGTTYAGGAGGGYSGGAGVAMASGWGTRAGGAGGSYNIGTAQVNTAASNTTTGQVTITELCSSMATTVSDDTVCVGDEVILHAEPSGAGTITWDGGVTDSVAFTPSAGSTTYTATSTDPNDCPFSVDIFVGDYPTVDGGTDEELCEGDSVALSGTGTATDYAWDGGVIDGDYFVPSAGTTTYVVTGTIDSTGCAATDTVNVTLTVIDESTTAESGTVTAAQAGATYQWVECPAYSAVAGETGQSFTPTVDGDYAVIITLNGCVDTSACTTFAGVKIDENDFVDFTVIPNPTSGQITIAFEGDFEFSVINVLGSKVAEGKSTNTVVVDLELLPAGQYFVKVLANDAVRTAKIIKK